MSKPVGLVKRSRMFESVSNMQKGLDWVGHAHRRGKGLIVEDNASNRSFMTEICGAFGWNCDAVDGGIACVDAVSRETETYEVILMDIHMPDMSGIEAAARSVRCKRTRPANYPSLP